MDLQSIRSYLNELSDNLTSEERAILETRLTNLTSAFPFNEYEFILMFLIDRKAITFEQYDRLRQTYVSQNQYLNLFGLAPRIFGQEWGEAHLRELDSRLLKPNRLIDPDYVGQYDLWTQGVRVEVKAARAIDTKKRGDLVSKALRYNSNTPFWMNYQQLKLGICDVFVFIGVWADEILYWVLSDQEVRTSPYLSHQHRGGVEYQIGVTEKNIRAFDIYRVLPTLLWTTVVNKGTSQND